MRETEDELIRNMLASTASVINCTAGKHCAGFKSALIEVEAHEGDTAQALMAA